MVTNAELVDAAAEVGVQLGLRRVEVRPVVALGERVAVVVVGDVHPAARVGVLLPGAADVVVLLEDRVVDAGLLRGGSAAMIPLIPEPTMATWNGRSRASSPWRHCGARRSLPCRASSSTSISMYSSIGTPPARNSTIVCRSASSSTVVAPASRNRPSASAARSRIAACCSGVSPACSGSAISAGSMRSSGRSSDRSPVMYASVGSSDGRSASSSLARISSFVGGDRWDRAGQRHSDYPQVWSVAPTYWGRRTAVSVGSWVFART